MIAKQSTKAPFLAEEEDYKKRKKWSTAIWYIMSIAAVIFILLTFGGSSSSSWLDGGKKRIQADDTVESWKAVVAADDARCSEIGVSVLRAGGHAVDASVAVALCVGVVNPMASGIGGGGFMVVRSAATSETLAFDFRETAPLAASEVRLSILRLPGPQK